MSSERLNRLVDKIRDKRELKGISREVAEEMTGDYLNKKKINLDKISERDEEIIKKDIRAQLRQFVGRFSKFPRSKQKYIEKKDFSKLAETHSSTKERMASLQEIKKLIRRIMPRKILDLGCGLNPLLLAEPGIEYYAVDINESDLEIVRKYFAFKGIIGNVISHDIRKIVQLNLPNVDLCLILKVLDLIDKKGHKTAEAILDSVKSTYLLISFSSRTLSGKPMNHPQRGWIERLLTRKNWPYKMFKTSNEIFYFAKKTG